MLFLVVGLCGLLCGAKLAPVPELPGACELADCVDPWWASRCRRICPEGADAAACSDLRSTQTRSDYHFQAANASNRSCIVESIVLMAGGTLDTAVVVLYPLDGVNELGVGPFETIGRFNRDVVASLMHAGSVADRSRFGLDAIGLPPFYGLYVSYLPWGGVGSQRMGLIATCELAERLGAKMIADPSSFSVFDRAHFIQAGNTVMDPDSVVCADVESVVYHHGCAIVGYAGERGVISFVGGGETVFLEYDPIEEKFFLDEPSCFGGRKVPSERKSFVSSGLPPIVELESKWQRVTASRHTVGWYDKTALFLHALTDLDFVNALLSGMISPAPVQCVVLSFLGFDGMIGVPNAEVDVLQRDGPLSAVNSIWAKWLPSFAPRHHLREVVNTIGVALRPDTLHAHVACVHVRMSTCSNVVFEKLSERAPFAIDLAHSFMYTAAVVERSAGMFRPEALLRFLEANNAVSLLADVAEVVGCAKGLIVNAFEALRSWQVQQASGLSHGDLQPAVRVLLCSEIANLLLPIASLLGLVNTSASVVFHDQFEFVSQMGCDPLKSLVSRNAAPETDKCALVLSDACARNANWMFSSSHASTFPQVWALARRALDLPATFIL
jgi:hypothetical protein